MKKDRKTRRRSEDGIALLIAIFVLLLISVVAIALLVSSGTETALGANYRASSTVYYAALAGLEEARGRLVPKDPNYLGAANVLTPFPLNQTLYVINRTPGDSIQPWDQSNPYYDKEYKNEFGVEASSVAFFHGIPSLWDNNAQSIPGPIYKWVRINAVTDQSLFMEIDNTAYHPGTAVYYDPAHLDYNGNPWPSLVVGPTSTAMQVLEITAMAALPNGSQKYLQYLVAPTALNLSFPAALTLSGNNVGNNATYPFSVPGSDLFLVNGTDQFGVGSCVPGPNPVAAIGYTNNAVGDTSKSTIRAAVITGIPLGGGGYPGNYTGTGGATPNVNYVGPLLAANLQTVSGLDTLVQTVTQNADVVINGPATQSDMPGAMSSTNPMTVVVNGDLTFNGWHNTGYGLLLVTGQFTYDPDASWDGIVLVIGKGIMYAYQGGGGRFHGAVFLATTVDPVTNNPLPPTASLGSPTLSFTPGAGGFGIYYSSCQVQYVQTPSRYQVLSFHEIPQQ